MRDSFSFFFERYPGETPVRAKENASKTKIVARQSPALVLSSIQLDKPCLDTVFAGRRCFARKTRKRRRGFDRSPDACANRSALAAGYADRQLTGTVCVGPRCPVSHGASQEHAPRRHCSSRSPAAHVVAADLSVFGFISSSTDKSSRISAPQQAKSSVLVGLMPNRVSPSLVSAS